MPLDDGPCESWPYLFPCPPGQEPDLSEYDAETLAMVESAATYQLWALAGRRYGTCETTVRPCAASCADSLPADWGLDVGGGWPATPVYLGHATWVNVACGCSTSCSCTAVSRIDLSSLGPVASIVDVTIDGVSLPVTGSSRVARVDDARYLTRVDGGTWPMCQDLSVDPPADGAWTVTVEVGLEVPHLGQLAMGEVVMETLKACGGNDCLLPAGAVTVTKRGVTIDLDPEKLTPFVRSFIQAVNPGKLRRSPRVLSPDTMPPTRPTW